MSELHLTRASISLGRPPVRERGVTAEYLLHQAVADLFGDRGDRGYVWREIRRNDTTSDVLLLSDSEPDPSATHGMPRHRRVVSLVTKPFRPELHAGQKLDFEIRVNATRVVTTPAPPEGLMDIGGIGGDGARKQRFDVWDAVFAGKPDDTILMSDVYASWLRGRLADVADLGEVAVTERRSLRVRRSLGNAAIPIVTTNLVGDLTVRYPERLLTLMGSGIGRARAFGCGLLCLARLGSRPRRPSIPAAENLNDRAVRTSMTHG